MATPITRYAQSVAIEQIPFANFPGGGPVPGPTSQGGFSTQFNDPGLELGYAMEVTSIYQMYGNEASSDLINVYLAQPGDLISPAFSSISGSGIATTATVDVGDDDITGYGLVSSGVAFGAQPPAAGLGANPTRYASAINVATGQTNPVSFAGGTALTDPYVIGALAIEPQGQVSSPGAGIAGSWVQLRFRSIGTPVAGQVLVIRLKIVRP